MLLNTKYKEFAITNGDLCRFYSKKGFDLEGDLGK